MKHVSLSSVSSEASWNCATATHHRWNNGRVLCPQSEGTKTFMVSCACRSRENWLVCPPPPNTSACLTVAWSHLSRTHLWQMEAPCPTLPAPWSTSTGWRRTMRRSSGTPASKTSSSPWITQRATSLPLRPSSCTEL